ncbi:MAG TPA: type II secretion system protein [Candidatus Gastranaerophilales bacterium]|nr:type II secretion system protein [Candidatus Gastranaerophilales bacterium]
MNPKIIKTNRGGGKSLKGFTLAEVLVVIFLIGVIAGETIPVLLTTYQEKELLIRWKKQYSIASQAVISLQNQNGDIYHSNHFAIRNQFCSIMNCMKNGETQTLLTAQQRQYNLYKSSNSYTALALYELTAIMSDGSLWVFLQDFDSGACHFPGVGISDACGTIIIDVNGAKKPNMSGKDLFYIYLRKSQTNGLFYITPYGTLNDGWSCAAETHGKGCSANALLAKTPAEMP